MGIETRKYALLYATVPREIGQLSALASNCITQSFMEKGKLQVGFAQLGQWRQPRLTKKGTATNPQHHLVPNSQQDLHLAPTRFAIPKVQDEVQLLNKVAKRGKAWQSAKQSGSKNASCKAPGVGTEGTMNQTAR